MKLSYFFPFLTLVSASSFCDDFLQKEIPQVVKSCGYADIVPYCCSNKNIETLKSYSNDFQILCEDTPEQQQGISNITSNIDKLSTECSKQADIEDDWNKENNSLYYTPNYLLTSFILFITLF